MTLPVSLKKAEELRNVLEEDVRNCVDCKNKIKEGISDCCQWHYAESRVVVERENAEKEFASFLETARKELDEAIKAYETALDDARKGARQGCEKDAGEALGYLQSITMFRDKFKRVYDAVFGGERK